MKTIASFACLGLGAILAAGCATDGDAYGKSEAPQPGEIVVDGRYVSIVEKKARERGMNVVWVNVPTRRVPTPVVSNE